MRLAGILGVEQVKEHAMPSTNPVAQPVRAARRGESVARERPAGDAVASDCVHERIRRRAFELFLARCGGHGDALSDWLEAERQLRAAELRRGREDSMAAERGEALLSGESD